MKSGHDYTRKELIFAVDDTRKHFFLAFICRFSEMLNGMCKLKVKITLKSLSACPNGNVAFSDLLFAMTAAAIKCLITVLTTDKILERLH